MSENCSKYLFKLVVNCNFKNIHLNKTHYTNSGIGCALGGPVCASIGIGKVLLRFEF